MTIEEFGNLPEEDKEEMFNKLFEQFCKNKRKENIELLFYIIILLLCFYFLYKVLF